MKKHLEKLLTLILIVVAMAVMTSCGDEDDEPLPDPDSFESGFRPRSIPVTPRKDGTTLKRRAPSHDNRALTDSIEAIHPLVEAQSGASN